MLLTTIKNSSTGQMLWVAGESNTLHWLRSRTHSSKRLRQTEVKQPTAPHKIQVGGLRGNSEAQWREEAASRAPTINTSLDTNGTLLWPRVESVTYVTRASTNVKMETMALAIRESTYQITWPEGLRTCISCYTIICIRTKQACG